jgi:DNA-binding MurR/RpiR family transcriptional regulator
MNDFEMTEAIRRLLPELGGQMAEAARYLVSHPEDVAVHSMRELARRADVPPVNLVRIAQRLGLPGYSDLRQRYINDILRGGARPPSAATRNVESARAILATARAGNGHLAFAESFFAAEQEVLKSAQTGLTEAKLARTAQILGTAPKIFVVGRRTAYPAAFTLAYALRKARPNVRILDDTAGAPESELEEAAPQDVMVAFTFAPFSRLTDSLARRAAAAGATIIGIADSQAAPLHDLTDGLFFTVPSRSRAFPESAGGAIAIANLFAAIAVAQLGEVAQKRIRSNERFLVNSGEYLLVSSRSRSRRRRTEA